MYPCAHFHFFFLQHENLCEIVCNAAVDNFSCAHFLHFRHPLLGEMLVFLCHLHQISDYLLSHTWCFGSNARLFFFFWWTLRALIDEHSKSLDRPSRPIRDQRQVVLRWKLLFQETVPVQPHSFNYCSCIGVPIWTSGSSSACEYFDEGSYWCAEWRSKTTRACANVRRKENEWNVLVCVCVCEGTCVRQTRI